jgi:3D (Asp-Asp-Asp) domain-containing protein
MNIFGKIYIAAVLVFIIFGFDLNFIARSSDDSKMLEQNKVAKELEYLGLDTIESNSIMQEPNTVSRRYYVTATGYSSTPDQTDSTPFITATGNLVRDGIIAANFLPFGTKIRIPELFKTKIFVIDDRMNPRNSEHIDVWFPTREEAIMFGKRLTYIEIVN